MVRLRHAYLTKQLEALVARVDMLGGRRMTFDESRALYDAVAPTYAEAHFQAVLDRIATLLPGAGTLAERYDRPAVRGAGSGARQGYSVVGTSTLAGVYVAAVLSLPAIDPSVATNLGWPSRSGRQVGLAARLSGLYCRATRRRATS